MSCYTSSNTHPSQTLRGYETRPTGRRSEPQTLRHCVKGKDAAEEWATKRSIVTLCDEASVIQERSKNNGDDEGDNITQQCCG
jgi:hypothetical protein